MNDEFYIGWQAKAPVRTASTVRRVIILLAGAGLALAIAAAVSQQLIGRSVFEWGQIREFSGVVKADPVPHLIVMREGALRRYYLVHPWKFGFEPALAAKFDGEPVTLRGTLIRRDDQAMIEMKRGSLARNTTARDETLRLAAARSEAVSLGEHTFVGEIVDSKCFLGVMNPGQLKPHRACAVRCISGGVPPVLLVRDAGGAAHYLFLVSRDNKPVNRDVLKLVAEPVRITGELVREGEMLFLRADPRTYRRL